MRHCRGLDELAACIDTERAVWGAADIDLVPLPLFVVAAHTGGEVLGAFDGDRMVGFTLALAGLRNGRPLLHSHMTAVRESYRDRGVGRRLKLFQRADALSRGIDRVEWTFDPLEVEKRLALLIFGWGRLRGATCRTSTASLPVRCMPGCRPIDWSPSGDCVRRGCAVRWRQTASARKAAPARGKQSWRTFASWLSWPIFGEGVRTKRPACRPRFVLSSSIG